MAQCVYCKGFHPGDDRTVCPVVIKTQSLFRVKEMLKSETFYGSSPAPFIGRTGYPEVNVGILSPTEIREDAWLHDAPGHWAQQNFQIPRIAELRFSLVNSRSRSNIKNETKIVELSREVGIASKPVDVEIKLKKIPNFKLNIDAYSAPFGPGASIEKASITSNPKVDSKVEKVVSDKDLKAGSAVTYLYSKGYDENFLSKVLSVGAVGIGKNRKLVPTRWSITATDDTIAKYILAEIRDFSEIDYSAYFGSYLGNYYIILCFPGMWGYELFEMYLPSAGNNSVNYSTDYEDWKGRKNYAENCAGGYYSVRLAILEKLMSLKRKGSVLALRFITDEYSMPLGVWVTREAARKALACKPIEFSDKELMLKYTDEFVKKKFSFDANKILSQSKLLNNLKVQKKLADFRH
ncbi:MAG TPA: hypothetical protein VI894_03630 [Candidatus Nanoarchaeia archaeon]|nr:hypothetical protein [Candidatus Nanoarchaeia archaeon]